MSPPPRPPRAAPDYRKTIRACYLANLVQATIVNLPPVLFLALREAYGFSYTQLGALVLVNFVTQVVTDLSFSRVVDKHGYRAFVVGGHFAAAAGLSLFALAPTLSAQPYALMVAGTVIFSIGSGLMELLLSPIVNAVPTDDKIRAMSLLHSVYAWGSALVVLLTTAAIFFFGTAAWPLFMLAWALIPLANGLFFTCVPLAQPFRGGGGEGVRATMRASGPLFLACALLILLGDAAGMAGFAIMLGTGRALGAKYGGRLRLTRVLAFGAALAAVCYLAVSLSGSGAVALLACALCGIGVSLMWPGALIIAADAFPRAGTWMFAFMAAAGDIGASAGPWLVGVLADSAPRWGFLADLLTALGPENLGLRAGLLAATAFPLAVLAALAGIARGRRKSASP